MTWAPVGAIVLLTAAALAGEFLIWPDWDATWLIAAARMIRSGATLYSSSLIEINPPTIIDVARLSVALSARLGFSAITWWRLQVFVVELVTLLLSWTIVNRLVRGAARAWLTPLAVVLVAGLACLPGINFGQREHLVLLLVTPYALASAAALDLADGVPLGLASRLLCGVLAAVALSIKPHYLVLIATIEAGVLVTAGWRACLRRETISLAIAAGLLALVQLARYPGYLSFAVPLAWRFYREYGSLHWQWPYVAYLLGGTLPVLIWRLRGGSTALPQQVLLAGLGAFLALLIQAKGWDYHFVPARGLLFLAGGIATLLWLQPSLDRWAGRAGLAPPVVITAAVLALSLPLTALMVTRTRHIAASHWPHQFAQLQQVIDRSRSPEQPFSMTTLTVELFPAFPVVEVMGGRWASRYSCLWTIPAIDAREREGMSPEVSGRADLVRDVAADLMAYRPTYILVQAGRSPALDGVLAAPQVHEMLQAYHQVATLDDVAVWMRDAREN